MTQIADELSCPMRLLEEAPDHVEEKIGRSVPAGEELLVRVFADLDLEGRYTTRWVVVTDKWKLG